MGGNLELAPERRRCLRQKVHGRAFASFDGVSGGMILDLSEEGLSMQVGDRFDEPLFYIQSEHVQSDRDRRVRMQLDLANPPARIETTGYIAWADALGRAGVRFSDLPEEARQRLNEWLTANATAPSQIAPKVEVARAWGWGPPPKSGENGNREHMAVSLEVDADRGRNSDAPASATVQYEFNPLGNDLAAALRLIGERARILTRSSSAAIALEHKGAVICRASIGDGAPALGARLNINSGFAGECFREGKTLRCDDAVHDPRVDLESCRRLGVRSMVAAPVRYERNVVGLLMVLASEPFTFDEGDVAVVDSLAHTIVRA